MTTPRLELDLGYVIFADPRRVHYRDNNEDAWVCRQELLGLAKGILAPPSYRALVAAPAIWLTVSNRPSIHAVRCVLEPNCNYMTPANAELTNIWDVFGDFIAESLHIKGGGTCYISLDYDDGK